MHHSVAKQNQSMTIQQTITIGAKTKYPLTVNRLGYGTMRLTGEGIYGEPANRPEALEILRQTVSNGINFLDTADYYGEDVTNRLIAEALYPYQQNLVICTKVGGARKPDKSWIAFNTPANLRTSIEQNLRTLKQNQIQLVHYRVMPGMTPEAFKLGLEAMFAMQQEGKILHVGISNVSTPELTIAMQMGEIASVENMFGHAQRTTLKTPYTAYEGGAEVLELCEKNEIPFIPYYSLFASLPKMDTRIAELAKKYTATEAQINIAWLLHRSPWILPIPGTSSLNHFHENCNATTIILTQEDMHYLD